MKKSLLMKTMLLLCALVVGSASAWADNYERITSTSGLEAGKEYILVCEGQNKAMGSVNSYGASVDVTISSNKITATSALNILTLGGETGAWTFYTSKESKYLTWSSGNSLNVGSTAATDADKWTISFDSDNAIINNKGTSDRKLRFNAGSPRFACYTSAQTHVQLYKKIEAAGAATTVTINSTGITNTNKFVSTEAGTLTATVTYGSPAAAVPGAAVTWSSSNTSVATVDESTGIVTLEGEGSTTITASYAGKSGEYKSSYAEYVLNVTDEDPNMITLWSEDFSGFDADDVPSGGTYGYVCVNGNSDTKIYTANMAGGTSPELLVNKSGGSFTATIPLENIIGNLKLKFKSNAYAVTVSTSTEGITISGDASFNAAGEHTVTFTGVTTSMTSVEIKFAAGSSNVRIDDIVLKGSKVVPVTVTVAGLATFASDYKLDFTNVPDLEAYIAKEAAGVITLEQVNKVAAGTGVLLRALNNANEFKVPVTTATADAITGNLFVRGAGAAVASQDGGYYNYVLGKHNDEVGFYKAGGMTVATDKAYIQTTVAAARILFDFDNETTSINEVSTTNLTNNTNEYFNLAGQHVAQPTKGLYIVNGKKYVIK